MYILAIIYFKSDGGLYIGDNTHISRNVTIAENVWIGMNVTIALGVTIKKEAIIGIGTVVNRDVEELEIVGSSKTQHLKYRYRKHYEELSNSNRFGGVNGKALTSSQTNAYKPSYKEKADSKIIFILGTGRSRTKSIVDILNQNPNC